MEPPPSMKEVAAAAGVHQTTVSLALRNHYSLPRSTCERIQKLARTMGYRPNPLVSALIAERRKRQPARHGSTLAFLTSSPMRGTWRSSRNYRQVFASLVDRALELGYKVEEFWLKEPGMTPDRLSQILLNRGIRGIVVCPLPTGQRTLDFNFSEFAAVALGLSLNTPRLDRIAIDYHEVITLAIHKLRETGHRHIGLVTSTHTDSRVNHLHLGSFLAARHQQPKFFTQPFAFIEKSSPSLLHWVRTQRPDAIIAAIESEYQFVRDNLADANMKLPDDLSLICLDCLSRSGPGGIVQNLTAEAIAAVDLVTSRVERAQFGIPAHPQTILISGSWRDGEYFTSK